LSVAFAEAAIQAGFGAYFITAHDMVSDPGRAYREGRLDRRMRVYLARIGDAPDDRSARLLCNDGCGCANKQSYTHQMIHNSPPENYPQ
jgi:hypothetical protein